MIRHFRRWYAWQKNCLNSPWHKLLVLFGLRRSPTFELYGVEFDFSSPLLPFEK